MKANSHKFIEASISTFHGEKGEGSGQYFGLSGEICHTVSYAGNWLAYRKINCFKLSPSSLLPDERFPPQENWKWNVSDKNFLFSFQTLPWQ